MSLTPAHEKMIGIHLDGKFLRKYKWSLGPGDFTRLCDTARPEVLQIEPIQDYLTETLSLQAPGDNRTMSIPMPEILFRIAHDNKGEVDLATSCEGCRGKVSITPEGFKEGEEFCVLAMIEVLRRAGVGVHQLRVVLDGVKPVGKQNKDFTDVKLCRHEFNK